MAAAKKVQPTEGVVQTVMENELPEADKTTTLTSPWGSKVTVAADTADLYKDAGFTTGK